MVDKVGLTTPQQNIDTTVSEGLQAGTFGNPFLPQDSSGNLKENITNTLGLLDIVTDTSQFEEPEQVDLGPQVLFSPSKQKMFVNGVTFDIDDYQSAVDSKQYLTQPAAPAPMDIAQDWIRVSPETYGQYMKDIQDPSTGTLMARNFEIGMDNLKLLTGRGLQFYGKEEAGKEWVDEALADLYKNQPFQREFQNESGEFVSNGLVDWFVANLAQQGPMILESIAVALVGGVAGGLAGGGANPFSAFGGALTLLAKKESFKQGVLAAAKKYSKNQPMTVAEKKLLREASGLAGATKVKNDVFYNNPFTGAKNRAARDEALEYTGAKIAGKAGATQARIGGAAGFSILGAQQLGQADIYGEVRETGVGDRGTAFLGSFPYAAAEVIPEFILGLKVLGLNPAKFKSGTDALKRGPKSLIRRAGEGIAVGGALEGATELAQESILLGGTDQLGDAGTFRRLLNAFAAGFAIGGPIGGIANLKTDKAADVLNPEGNKEPEPTKPKAQPEPPVGTQLELFGPEVTSRTRDTRRNPTGVPQPEPVETPQPTQLNIFGGEDVIPTQPETDPNQLELDLTGQQQPTITGQQSLLTPTGRARNRRRQQAAAAGAAGATGAAATAGPSASNLQVSDPIGSPIPAPNPVLQRVQQAGQSSNLTPQTKTPSSGQPEIKPETDINNDLYKLKTGRTISTFDQQELLDQRDRLIRKKKLNKREDKDLQAIQAAILRREAAMATGAAVGVEAGNRLQQIVNEQKQEQKQIDELNKQNAKILKEAEREAKRREAEVNPDVLEEAIKALTIFISTPGVDLTTQEQQDLREGAIELIQENNLNTIGKFNTFIRSDKFPRADDIKELDKTNKFIRDNNIDVNSEQFISEAQEVFGDMGPVLSRQFAAEQIIQQRNEQEGGTQDAIQEQGTNEVVTEEPTGRGETVPRGDQQPANVEAAGEGQENQGQTQDGSPPTGQETKIDSLKRGRENIRKQVQESTNRARENRVDTAPPKPTRDPATVWASLGTALTYDNLPPEVKTQFENDPSLTRAGEPNLSKLKIRYQSLVQGLLEENDGGDTNADILLDAQADIEGLQGETTADVELLRASFAVMLDIAYFGNNPNPLQPNTILNGKSERQFVNDFLLITNFTDQQLEILRETFISSALSRTSKTLTYETKGTKSDWVIIGEKLTAIEPLMEQAKQQQFTLRSFPIKIEATQDPTTDRISQTTQEETKLSQEIITTELANLLDDHITGTAKASIVTRTQTSGKNKGQKNKAIVDIENKFKEANPEFLMNGVKLKDYFDKDGNLNLGKANIDGVERLIPKPINKQPAPSPDQIIEDADAKEGDFYKYDGTKIENPIAKGQAELVVKQVLKKLKTKPKVTVVRNRDELRETNPELYKRAVEARDDFEIVNASGYSFGDQIIIFTDFVKNEQMLRSVIGHEALGHFGFKAFVPNSRLKLILDDIYKSDPAIRAVADRRMANGEERYEAIEEVLADYAAHVDTHILARFYNAIKNFLRDAFGIEFQDDMTRYLVFQSRKNLRTGGSGVVTVRQMASNIERLRNESTYGRYNAEASSAVAYKSLYNQLITLRDEPGGLLQFKSFFDKAKQKGKKLYDGSASDFVGKILEEFQTLDNIALRNEGLSKIFALFQGQTARTRKYQSIYHDMTRFTHSLKNIVTDTLGFTDGPTNDELTQAGELLAYYALYKSKQLGNESTINNAPSLIEINQFGERRINEAVFEKMKADNMPTQQELTNGFEVVLDILENGEPNTGGQTFNYKPNFEVTDRVYKIFQENRNAVNEAAKDLLESNLEAVASEKQDILSLITDVAESKKGIGSSAQDIAAGKVILQKYIDLYSENATLDGVGISYSEESRANAESFLRDVNRALWKTGDENKLNDWISNNTNEVPILNKPNEDFTDVVNSLQQLHEIYSGERADAKILTNTIQNLLLLDYKNVNNEFNAKRTIMGAYVPFTRRGNYQVTLRAFDDNNNEIELDDHTKNVLPYYQVDTKQDAEQLSNGLIEDFSDTKYKFIDKNLQEVEVNLRPETSEVGSTAPLSSSMNLNEFTSILVRLNINLKPEQMKKVTTALTKQSDRARKSLQRSGTAGWDTDVIRSVSEHLETMSHSAGKTFYSHKLNKYTMDKKLWMGDKTKLNRLKEKMEEVERTGNDEQIKLAQQQYDSYANMYRYSAGDVAGETITVYKGSGRNREAVQVKTEGRGRRYRDVAGGLLAFYGKAGNIDVSTEDILSGEAGSFIKLVTVTSQLGGSVATGLVNMISMVSHSIPFLSTYNAKTGYGGGFGLVDSAGAMTRAIRTVANPKLEQLSHVREVANGENATELQNKYGLTQDEAQVLLEATEQGVLQAAQFNALVGTARGGLMAKKNLAGFVRGWMKIFSVTEQLNRRTTFLAAYRLQRTKLENAGGLTQKQISENARDFAIKAVNTSQGEYGMFNRPSLARGPIGGLIFMYKQFVIITVELMKNLGTKERVAMLSLLILMAGLKGLPFADDVADLADTLMQKFGIKRATVEKELNMFIEDIAPGWSPIVMRGFLDYWLGATVSTRLGFSDLVPLTGIAKAGSNSWQEAKNFFGPVYSAGEQSVALMSLLARQGAEAIGLKDDTTTWTDVLKNQPFGAIKGVTEGLTYAMDGPVTNKEGKVLMKEASTLQTIFRFLNFYPAGATYQNDVIRMSKQTDGYVKAIKKSYTDAWVKAKIAKDRVAMRRLEKEVREHNKDHRGTEFELKGWLPSAQRAFRAWSLPAAERYKKFAPKNIRPETQFLLDAYENAINDY